MAESERLIAAEDKQIAGDWVLRRINHMKHKTEKRPISFGEEKNIIELVGRRVVGEARSEGADPAAYTEMINCILGNLDKKVPDESRPSEHV